MGVEMQGSLVMLYKKLFKCIMPVACLFCFVAAIQTGAAIYFSKMTAHLEPAELVMVFPGESYRIKAGIELVKDSLAPRFMVVNTTDNRLREILKKNGASETIRTLHGGISRSTFEDVYQVTKMIQENQLDSVIVATSSYHLPRALFLLRVYLKISGEKVRIQGFPIKEEQETRKKIQQYGNETIKLWGSMIEMTGYYMTGQLFLDSPSLKKIQRLFKKNLLL